ncbi:MAG: mechanosensitive ion channel domain-containing protein [Pseudomonadota bacterium]
MLKRLSACLLLSLSLSASGQTADQTLSEQISQLDRELQALQELGGKIDQVPERDREILLSRVDQRSFRVLNKLDQISRTVAKLPEDDPDRLAFVERLGGELADVGPAIIVRIGELDERITAYLQDADAAGGNKVAQRARADSLDGQRFKYNLALAKVVESREALGLDASPTRDYLLEDLYLHAEVLSGRLEFADAARKEIQFRLGQDPANADLVATLNTINADHALYHEELEAVADLLQRLGANIDTYQAILLQQGTGVSVDVFRPNVALQLLQDGWSSMQTAAVENAPDLLFRILLFFLVILIFRYLSRLTRRMVEALLARSKADLSSLMKNILVSVSGGLVMALGFLMALSQAGISIGPALAGLGVAGFVVGFALQDTLGNFASGAMILFYRPYDVDDYIQVAGAEGLVKEMSLVSTTIATIDNQVLVVPNSKIWGDVIRNVTAQRLRRVDLIFGISYGDDVEQAEKVLEDIVYGHEKVLKKPAALIKVHELGDSSVNFAVRPWVRTEDYWNVYWDLTREVKLRFDREGISIPFPQRDVHHYRESPPPEAGA